MAGGHPFPVYSAPSSPKVQCDVPDARRLDLQATAGTMSAGTTGTGVTNVGGVRTDLIFTQKYIDNSSGTTVDI